MIDQLVEEMHAKVLARVPMTLTVEQTNEILEALGRPFVHPGVPELSTEVAAEEPATEAPEAAVKDSETAPKKSTKKGGK